MRKIIGILGLSLMTFSLLAGCSQQSVSRSYTNTMYGFSLNPPLGWQHVENASAGEAVRFNPANQSNVSLVVGIPFSLGEGLALSAFADMVEENLSSSGMNYSVAYRDWRPMKDATAYEIVYSYEQNGTTVRVKQVSVLKTRTVYLITFVAPYDLYVRYITTVDQCIDSFTF
jgi:hypothetical protein